MQEKYKYFIIGTISGMFLLFISQALFTSGTPLYTTIFSKSYTPISSIISNPQKYVEQNISVYGTVVNTIYDCDYYDSKNKYVTTGSVVLESGGYRISIVLKDNRLVYEDKSYTIHGTVHYGKHGLDNCFVLIES